MQPEVMLFMFVIILITINLFLMSIEYWKDRDNGGKEE